MRLRLLAIPAVLGLLLAAAGFLRADDKQLPLRVWLFRLPGTELGLDVAEMNGDTAQDLVAAHMTSPSSAGLDRSVSVYYQGPKGERFRGEADRRYRVPADACAFVAGDFDPAPGGEVVFICPTRVVLVRGRNELVRVAAIDGFFDYPENHGLPVWTMAWDLDGDALPELIVPTKEGYALFKRTGLEAPLAEVSRLKVPVSIKFGPAFETQLLNRFLSTSSRLRRLVAVDLDRDGRKDLVAYRDKGLARFLQRPDGTFPERPDREEPVELVQGNKGSEKKDESTEAFANVRLSLADVDGDGRADLLATRTVGELGVFETLRTQQLVFRGTDEGGWDESKPDVILNFKGISDDPVLLDWDGDGKQDLIMSSYRMDMFTNVKRALTDSMTITYMIFRQGDGEGLLPDEPSFSIDAEVPLSVLERRGGIRAMLFTADLNGDKVRDMVARRADGGLKVVLGLIDDGEPGFDEDNPIRLGVGRTNPPWVRDLDGDGKDELLLEPFGGADLGARTVRVVGVAR